VRIRVGQRLPNISLAKLGPKGPIRVPLEDLFYGRRAVVLGAPGAFTPTCTELHLPDFLRGVDMLRRSGFSRLICVAANDPWSVNEWAKRLDPDGRIQFLSDGNLEFAKAIGVDAAFSEFFMGPRSERYMLTLRDMVVERIAVEPRIDVLTCTRIRDLTLVA